MNWAFYLKTIWLIGGRYFFIAGVAFIVFYILLRNKYLNKKIQARFPKNTDYLREIGYSILTISIFAFVAYELIGNPKFAQYTTRYADVHKYGWTYYFLAYPLMFVMHDAYFYFTHRLMHHKYLFKWFHLVHHQSINPSPWAAYAFHPLEAVVEVGIVVVFLFTIPIHRTHLAIFF